MEVRSSRRLRTLVTQLARSSEIARALISMMARSQRSKQKPDTLMQDRSPPTREIFLQRTAGPYIGSFATEAANSAAQPTSASPQKLTSSPNENRGL